MHWAELGRTGLYSAVLGFTSLYWAVLGCTGVYWAVPGCPGGPGGKSVPGGTHVQVLLLVWF